MSGKPWILANLIPLNSAESITRKTFPRNGFSVIFSSDWRCTLYVGPSFRKLSIETPMH